MDRNKSLFVFGKSITKRANFFYLFEMLISECYEVINNNLFQERGI